jgi:hypothetical protein
MCEVLIMEHKKEHREPLTVVPVVLLFIGLSEKLSPYYVSLLCDKT